MSALGASAPVTISKAGLSASHAAFAVQDRGVCDAEVGAMIGDVNFYLIPDPESDRDNALEGLSLVSSNIGWFFSVSLSCFSMHLEVMLA